MGGSSSQNETDSLKIIEEDWEYLTNEHGQQIVKHRHIDL